MSEPQGYSRAQIAIHWVVAALILFQMVTHDGMEAAWRALRRGQEYDPADTRLHVIAGVLVLAFMVWRTALRLKRGAPALPKSGNSLQDLVAKWVHRLIYALAFLIPVTGLAAWFGGIETAGGLHGLMFNGLLGLLFLHVLGAIHHQWILKDGLIRRIMKAE